jgi:nucleotide-binding universal stress UspA family protein
MFRLERILFPVDFSDRAQRAVVHARALAKTFGAELILLHVVQPLSYNTHLSEGPGGYWETFGKELMDLDVHVSRHTEHGGDVASKIIEVSKASHADLILMPTHGLGVYRRLILGSNTAKVLHDAQCPVWTDVHHQHGPHSQNVRIKHVACAINLEPSSNSVLLWAADFARKNQARLTLLHVASDPDKARPELERLALDAGVVAETRIEAGEPGKVVPHMAGELAADTLVAGRPIGSPGWGRLELTTYSIIRQSPCPVISV